MMAGRFGSGDALSTKSSFSWLRDPLWAFVAIGVLLFWLDGRRATDDLRIEVTDADVERLTAQWQAQTGRDPSAVELDGLINQFVEEEVYYREALTYKLETNDTIIRRRLVQKLTFLTEDVANSAEPSDDELRSFYSAHKDNYKQPQKYSFRHVYFSRDRRDDAAADANQELERVSRSASRDTQTPEGDPFMLQSNFAERSAREIASTFGVSFAEALPDLPIKTWSTPVASAYGHHLVYMHSLSESYTPDYEAVANRVANDYATDQRKQANNKFKEALLEKYTVDRP